MNKIFLSALEYYSVLCTVICILTFRPIVCDCHSLQFEYTFCWVLYYRVVQKTDIQFYFWDNFLLLRNLKQARRSLTEPHALIRESRDVREVEATHSFP